MKRYYKPARSPEAMRGLFSYINEFIVNHVMLESNYEMKLYCDFTNVPGYTSIINAEKNFFNYAFVQDDEDFRLHKDEYKNIEDCGTGNPELTKEFCHLTYAPSSAFTDRVRVITSEFCNRYLILRPDLQKEIDEIASTIDFNNTISIHRRATDIAQSNSGNPADDNSHPYIVPLTEYFRILDSMPDKKILVVSDNVIDTNRFKERYGDRILSFEQSSSQDIRTTFPSTMNVDPYVHVRDFIKNLYLASKCSLFIKSRSNASNFVILLNKDIRFILLGKEYESLKRPE